MPRFSRPKGTQDILPEDQPYWAHLHAVVTQIAQSYGFERIDIPIFESTELFARGVGEGTDIVDKEMYSFKDKGDRDITLRPEFTAGVMRAYIENGLHVQPKPIRKLLNRTDLPLRGTGRAVSPVQPVQCGDHWRRRCTRRSGDDAVGLGYLCGAQVPEPGVPAGLYGLPGMQAYLAALQAILQGIRGHHLRRLPAPNLAFESSTANSINASL